MMEFSTTGNSILESSAGNSAVQRDLSLSDFIGTGLEEISMGENSISNMFKVVTEDEEMLQMRLKDQKDLEEFRKLQEKDKQEKLKKAENARK
jgi:hypothetical protein